MVSGFFTSPCDHSRIFSGDASEMRIALNESGSLGFSKKLKMSRIGAFLLFLRNETQKTRRGEGRCSFLSGVVGGLRQLDELDVQTQGLKLLDENVEALGQAGLEGVLALDDGLVHPCASHDVVALDGQELLERVRAAVGFHRPDFHLAEALPAELGFATQRLLRDERVGADRTSVNLVV